MHREWSGSSVLTNGCHKIINVFSQCPFIGSSSPQLNDSGTQEERGRVDAN